MHKGEFLNIVKVTEYKNIEPGCSHLSYYECLAKRFITFDPTHLSLKNLSRSLCQFEKICAPYSLPLNKVEMCKHESDKLCYRGVLHQLKADKKILFEVLPFEGV